MVKELSRIFCPSAFDHTFGGQNKMLQIIKAIEIQTVNLELHNPWWQPKVWSQELGQKIWDNAETKLLQMGHQFMPHISDAKSTSHGKNAQLHDLMYLESTFLPYRGHGHL